MRFKETKLSGSYLIDLDLREDDRGFFARNFCEKEFSARGLNAKWVQVNNSLSKQAGTLRGLHFQLNPHQEIKLVRCIQGAVWDVIVDLRENSETFGNWFGVEINAVNRTMMYVPKGFAHGFISLEPNSEIIYLVSEFYNPESEQTLLWCDKKVEINWPQYPQVISEKDKQGKELVDIRRMFSESE